MDRPIFRLRLPWLSAVSAPRPAPNPRLSSETTVPIQRSTTGSPSQRPPSRTPGRAPTQRAAPKSQSQPQPKTESQPQPKEEAQPASQPPPKPKKEPETQPQSASQPPALPKIELPPASKPPSQPKTQPQPQPEIEPKSESQPRAQHKPEPQSASLPPPPTQPQTTSQQILPPLATAQSQLLSRPTLPSEVTSQQLLPQPATTQKRGTTEPQSPSPTLSKTPTQSPSKTSTKPISQSHTASKPQPTEETTSHPQSPLGLLSPSDQESGQALQLPKDERIPNFQPTIEDASQPRFPAPQQGPESIVLPQLTQESKIDAEIAAETIIKSKEQIQSETTTQPQVPTQPQKALDLVTTATQSAIMAPSMSKQTDKGKKVAVETLKEEKTEPPAHKDSSRGLITNLVIETTDSGTQIREAASKTFQAEEKNQQEKQDFPEEKKTLTSASPDTKQMKTATSTNMTSKSQQHPLMANRIGVPLQKEIMEDVSKFVNQLVAGRPNQALGEKSATVMTLAGENIGAFMQLAPESAKKEAPIHIYRGYKTNPDESPDATTDGEGGFKGRSSEDPLTKQPLTKSYINNNVQSINNSVFFESSVDERNPGVKLSLCQNLEEATKLSPKPFGTHKAEYKMSPSEKLTFEPTVRRRCLRGLFLEPSDSDTENPQKPRRHGCRFDCREKIKDIET